MKVESEKTLKIKLHGNDGDNFKSALKKITKDEKTTGYNNLGLNHDEADVIKKLSDKLK